MHGGGTGGSGRGMGGAEGFGAVARVGGLDECDNCVDLSEASLRDIAFERGFWVPV